MSDAALFVPDPQDADRYRRQAEAMADLAELLAAHAPDGPAPLPVVAWRIEPGTVSAYLSTGHCDVTPADVREDPFAILAAYSPVLGEDVREFGWPVRTRYTVKGRIGPVVGGRPRTLVGLTADIRKVDR